MEDLTTGSTGRNARIYKRTTGKQNYNRHQSRQTLDAGQIISGPLSPESGRSNDSPHFIFGEGESSSEEIADMTQTPKVPSKADGLEPIAFLGSKKMARQ